MPVLQVHWCWLPLGSLVSVCLGESRTSEGEMYRVLLLQERGNLSRVWGELTSVWIETGVYHAVLM